VPFNARSRLFVRSRCLFVGLSHFRGWPLPHAVPYASHVRDYGLPLRHRSWTTCQLRRLTLLPAGRNIHSSINTKRRGAFAQSAASVAPAVSIFFIIRSIGCLVVLPFILQVLMLHAFCVCCCFGEHPTQIHCGLQICMALPREHVAAQYESFAFGQAINFYAVCMTPSAP